ncbi:MAG: AbrB/MazE/SpoVT family DNA-binding domain-containing protein [Acetobacteraceae bacterium]|jgi:AbrB family looped-hinge helix DNA binding protein
MTAPMRLTTVVSTKGQVILPKAIRDQHRWDSGTRLMVESTGDGVLLKAASVFSPTRAQDVFGSLPRRGGPKTVAEMKFGGEEGMKQRHARDR